MTVFINKIQTHFYCLTATPKTPIWSKNAKKWPQNTINKKFRKKMWLVYMSKVQKYFQTLQQPPNSAKGP